MSQIAIAPDLTRAVYDALTQVPVARRGLAAISAHDACSSRLRRQIFNMQGKLDREQVFKQCDLEDLGAILAEVQKWIARGAKREFFWDEGCVSDGWFETVLPDDLALLQRDIVPLRELWVSLCDIRRILAADQITDRLFV
tara:strand:+ start:239 stop:661 length:423 start_codon:yes stop_codon:yes gene_type:complete